MHRNVTPSPANTTLALRSRWVRSVDSACEPDFFRSETARFMPMARLARMRNNV